MRVETIGNATLYLGDCLEVLPTLAPVNAVITDPPYGVNFKYESHDDDPEAYRVWRDKWFPMLLEKAPLVGISTGIRQLVTWPDPTWIMCWHKPACMGRAMVGVNNWEPFVLYGKPKRQINDVFRAVIVPDISVEGHPCPKPLQWGKELVGNLTEADETVLDPFMGSGTTGVACVHLGRKFIGIEVEPKYFDIACERIENAQRQERLFA